MKKTFPLLIIIFCCVAAYAQKQTFDVVTYTVPKGWQQQQSEGGVQLSVNDKKNNGYAIAIITKAIASPAYANENFTAEWNKLVKGTVSVAEAPSISDMAIETGWNCVTGQANYTDGNSKGLATLITATGGGQMASLVIMTNTDKYKEEILAFVNSLELIKLTSNVIGNKIPETMNNAKGSSIAGLWTDYTTESNGMVNGFPQPTGGYTRREYKLKTDGTYIFRHKYWSVYMKEILFTYETGTWKTDGNQLIIIPKNGRGEWWNKAASGKSSEWGSFKKASDYKPAAATYSFEFKYLSGMQQTYIILRSNGHVSRDGTTAETNSYEESFSARAVDKSLIDNPPGFK